MIVAPWCIATARSLESAMTDRITVPQGVVVYTTPYCVYCIRAKALLSRKGVAFREVDLARDHHARDMLAEETGTRRVPQVFVNGRFLGGHYELSAMERSGELDALL